MTNFFQKLSVFFIKYFGENIFWNHDIAPR
jgi:hypothetical protein